MPVSKEDVRNAFRYILGREPENYRTIFKYMLFPSVDSVRAYLLRSAEFQSKYRALGREVQAHPAQFRERPATAFIHLQKAGGTTLHALLARNFEPARVYQAPENRLHMLSVAELGWFDLFSGHFDFASLAFIQRRVVRAVAFFREPRERLVSFYRFMRSHPLSGEFAHSRSVQLAHELSAEAYFEHEEVRATPEVFNHYLLAFAYSAGELAQAGPLAPRIVTPQRIEQALRNVRALTAVGLTERYDESVRRIFRALGLPLPGRIVARHVTDRMGRSDRRFASVEPVPMTPRLEAALADLVRYDLQIYEAAKEAALTADALPPAARSTAPPP